MIITGPGRKITRSEAKRIIQGYKHTKWFKLCDGIKKEETKSVWFNSEFCAELAKDLQRTDVNGLRIYFGAYDGDDGDDGKKERMTVVLVSTTGDKDADWGRDELQPDEPKFNTSYNDGALCPPAGGCKGADGDLWNE
jgi:hypothetical protein